MYLENRWRVKCDFSFHADFKDKKTMLDPLQLFAFTFLFLFLKINDNCTHLLFKLKYVLYVFLTYYNCNC